MAVSAEGLQSTFKIAEYLNTPTILLSTEPDGHSKFSLEFEGGADGAEKEAVYLAYQR